MVSAAEAWDNWRRGQESKRRISAELARRRAENATNGTSFIQQYREAQRDGSKRLL